MSSPPLGSKSNKRKNEGESVLTTSSSSQPETTEHPQKRQYLGPAAFGGVSTASTLEDFVSNYQKYALLVRLDEQKAEISNINSKIRRLDEKQSKFDETISSVNQAWKQLNLDLKLLLSRTEDVNFDELKATKDDRSLLHHLLTGAPEQPNAEQINRELDAKSGETKDLVVRIVHLLEKQRSNCEQLEATIRSGDLDQKSQMIAKQNEELRKENAQLHKSMNEAHAQAKRISGKFKEMEDTETRLREKIKTMEEEMIDLKEKLDSTTRKLIKQEISFQEEVMKLHQQLNEEKSTNTITSDGSNGGNNDKLSINSPTHTNGSINMNKMEVDQQQSMSSSSSGNTNSSSQLQQDEMEELIELRKKVNERGDKIKQLQDEKVDLVRTLEQLKSQQGSGSGSGSGYGIINDQMIKDTPTYKSIMYQLNILLKDCDNVRSSYIKLYDDYENERRMNDNQIIKIKDEYNNVINRLNDDIKIDRDTISKLKIDNDQLKKKLDMKDATSASQLLQEYTQLLTIQKHEIRKYKEQVSKYQEDSNKLKTIKEDSKKMYQGLIDQLDEKTARLKDLESRISDYMKTIDDFKQRKKKWEERERDLKQFVDTYQSQSKEKRDLAEICVSERRYMEENSELKSKLEKYESMEMDKHIKEIEDKHQSELENVKKEANIKLYKSEKLANELREQLESQKSESENLMGEIEMIGKAFEDLQEQNTKLLQQLSEKEDTVMKVMTEQIKASQLLDLIKEEKSSLIDKLSSLESKLLKKDEILMKYDLKIQNLQDQLNKHSDESKNVTQVIESLKKSNRDSLMNNEELKVQIDEMKKDRQLSIKRAEDISVLYEKDKNQIYWLQDELQSMRKKIDRLSLKTSSSNIGLGGGGIADVLEEENKILKSKLTCGVCNDKQKSAVIARCFHVFCKPCVQKTLDVRSRKCPACGIKFAESDVHPLYLD